MIDLLSKSITGKLKTSHSVHIRDWSTDTSSSGLLSPVGSPKWRRGHRRQLSLTRFYIQPGKAICTAAAIALLTVVGLWWSFRPVGRVPMQEPDIEGDHGLIPMGQSESRDGREVFWWEQFPRLHGLYRGRKNIVPFLEYAPEQQTNSFNPFDPGPQNDPDLVALPSPLQSDMEQCYIDEERNILPPTISAYQGLPQGMSAPLFGSQKELGINDRVCYDRINRFAPYGLGFGQDEGGLGLNLDGDNQGLNHVVATDWRHVNWRNAQKQCLKKNADRVKSRTALVIRTWNTFQYSEYHIMMLRAMISELALASGGQYSVHFLIHVQDDTIPIWASQDLYNQVLRDSLPEEFWGMGSLWSVAQMKLIYPPPFPESIVNFSGGDIYEAYRSLHFPLQYFASRHPEYDYFWQWEMDVRVTGHYHELFHRITTWAERQPREYAWERSSKFFIPSLHDDSYDNYARSIMDETTASNKTPITGPQIPQERLLDIPEQSIPQHADEITDLITLNPLFDPTHTHWAFHDDITGYNVDVDGRPPTRAALITASRMSRRLLLLMHEETYRNKHTMFPEMFPASIALHYGFKAIYAPLPVYFDRNWPSEHANEVFNNEPLSAKSQREGMDHGDGYFHGEGGSVFGPGEHVFRGATYYSNAAFAGYLWRRWLGKENDNDEIAWESEGGYELWLVTAAAQISQTLTAIIKRAKKAPKECQDARAEVDDMRRILEQLQLFVFGIATASRTRTSLILVDQVVTTLAAAVTTFSELDVFVEVLDSDEKMGLLDRFRWGSKAKSLGEITQKLQLHKSSMSLMLAILTCQSTVEAEDKVDKLCDLVEQTLKQNTLLAERLAWHQMKRHNDFQKIHPGLPKNRSKKQRSQPAEDDNSEKSVSPDPSQPGAQGHPRAFVFEELLMKSRVYRKMAWDNSDTFSVLSSAGRTGTWSLLSGLSLSEMSNIAILALPVYATDLENKERYDFSSITEEPTIPILPDSQETLVALPKKTDTSSRPKISQIFSRRKKASAGAGTTTPAQEDTSTTDAPRVMGVPVHESIRYANVAISIEDEEGQEFIFCYLPIVVAKCCNYLKDPGPNMKGIFATNGRPSRVLALEQIFDNPRRRYGRGVDWTGFTIHDCAALLLRYLKALPEPIIPFDRYYQFTAPFRQHSDWKLPYDYWPDVESFSRNPQQVTLIQHCREEIFGLPTLNRQFLLYILDLFSYGASRWEKNDMPIARLVSVFHPAVLSGRPQEMNEAEHRLAQDSVIFLTHWQDGLLEVVIDQAKKDLTKARHST
ncbi:uncharacterized protein Z518_02697 [Rhinocladiella mackenziei CBS 650.93]|uniref:Rhinocladiella mackenziei CBS 650.93 unplaced genomic scaffold supercont1.2, whole genome shotgun sequence n=1 Tax=Rhinocladiella mackenziei CBS 650.93 TaxID=1442369 RepID=A0A0D2G0M1_9EURO|nr:uncharacterized protein Z518_02697 [Rhinocladiella mackenziei CBS 650.93]KIX08042.1 hypothetical protein Z518_02697 [Rhinocladiella mackenziei CBS 650.93]